MRYWIVGLSVIAAAVVAWPATAQPPKDVGETGGRGRGSELRERARAEFDKDGDGQLNEEEREAARDAMRERRERRDADDPPPRRERRRDGDRGPEGRRGPGGPAGGRRPERNVEALFVWFDSDGDNMLSRAEFGELSQFLRRRASPPPVATSGSPAGPQMGRRGAGGPPPGAGFGRNPDDGPPGPPRDRAFGRRGRGPDGPPRGDRPIRRGDRPERSDRGQPESSPDEPI